MGHLINPIRYRLGNSVFWANNWPVVEKTRYFLSYEIHQEMDQYFRTLFHYYRKLKLKRRRKTGKRTLRKYRYPKLYFSNVNINLFGLNLDKMMVDVNIYDFFLDHYLEDMLSSESLKNPKKLSELSKFLDKFNRYVGFEFFFKHKRILQKLTKDQFFAVIKVCRQKVLILEQIAVNNLQIFIEIYTEFIRRSLFSIYNDKKEIFNPTKSLFNKEKRLLYRLSFSKRVRLIHKYWTEKYSHMNPETGSLLTFNKYFTSEFFSLVTHRKQQKDKKILFYQAHLAKNAYKRYFVNFEKEQQFRQKLISMVFPKRVVEKFEKFIQKSNTIRKPPGLLVKNDNTYRTFPNEWHSLKHIEKYLGSANIKRQVKYFNPIKKLEFSIINFIKDFIVSDTFTILLYVKKWFTVNHKLFKNYIKITELLDNLINDLNFLRIKQDNQELIIRKIFSSLLKNNLTTFLLVFKKVIPLQYYQRFYYFNKNINKLKSLHYQYIKQVIKKTSTYWHKYDLDPFYQKYITYKNIKDLYINLNIGIGPEDDVDHDIIDSKFLTLYIKRLFKRRRFKVADLQRTMYRSLSRLPYLDGFVIIFAGRFTRRESKIHKISKGGVFHYGGISKLIDYHTIGFTSKFGYCGIKVFLQYKANWPTIEQQRNRRIINQTISRKEIQTTIDPNTNNKLIINPIQVQPTSKKYTRLVQQLFSRNQIPYYYNG